MIITIPGDTRRALRLARRLGLTVRKVPGSDHTRITDPLDTSPINHQKNRSIIIKCTRGDTPRCLVTLIRNAANRRSRP